MNNSSNKLSEVSYWDQVLSNIKIPRILNRNQFNVARFDRLFTRYITRDNKSLFEVGCGSSGWLPYFYKYYKLEVRGLDYSEIGCRFANENLKYFGADLPDGIQCIDLFQILPNNDTNSDVIFSYGVVEHFDCPETVISKVTYLLKPGGLIITVVPNLNGLFGYISRTLFPKIHSMHKVINVEMLDAYHNNNGYKKAFCGYYGTFYLDVIPWSSIDIPFLNSPIARRIFLKIINCISNAFSYILDLMHINFESKVFSPYVVYIGYSKAK